jgi:hypothetical protein
VNGMEEEAQWFQGVAKVLRAECKSLHILFRAEILTSLSLFRRFCSQLVQVLSLHTASFACKQQICGNGPGSIGKIRIFMCTLVEQLYNYATHEAVRYSEIASNERSTSSQAATSVSNLRIANGCTESNPTSRS